MTQSKESQQKQEQLAKNLGKFFTGMNETGRKEAPKPSPDMNPQRKDKKN